jgi:hypothetical protein
VNIYQVIDELYREVNKGSRGAAWKLVQSLSHRITGTGPKGPTGPFGPTGGA